MLSLPDDDHAFSGIEEQATVLLTFHVQMCTCSLPGSCHSSREIVCSVDNLLFRGRASISGLTQLSQWNKLTTDETISLELHMQTSTCKLL